MEKISRYAKVTELNGRPRLLEALPLAMQHVVAMIVGCVTPAIILAGVTGLEASEQIILIQSALLISASAVSAGTVLRFRTSGDYGSQLRLHTAFDLPWKQV